MRILSSFAAVLAILTLSLASSPAVAKKSCWVDHYHSGSGTGKSKRGARKAAIAAWQDFTTWEYGGAWGRYRLAKNKRVSCSGKKGRYFCDVSAVPCHLKKKIRKLRKVRKRKKRRNVKKAGL